MKKNTIFISLVLVLIFAFSTVNAGTPGIMDIDKSSGYAKGAILALAEKDIVKGDNLGNFNPTKSISRAEFITLLVRVMGLDTENVPATATFKDVPTNHWAFKYVEAAYKAGIVNGISPTEFGVTRTSTREQMAVMFVRALNIVEPSEKIEFKNIQTLTDKSSISTWAQKEVDIAMTAGLMNGMTKTSFAPKSNATKEQTAVVMDRFIQNEETIPDKVYTTYGLSKEIQNPNLYNALKAGFDGKFIGDTKMTLNMQMTDLDTKDFMKTYGEVNNTINNTASKTYTKMTLETNGTEPIDIDEQMIVTADKVYELDTDGKWIVYDRADWEDANGPADLSMVGVDSTGLVTEDFMSTYRRMPIEAVGTVEINNVTAEKYVMNLDSAAIKSLLPEEQYEEVSGLLADMYQGTEKYSIEFYVANGHIIAEKVIFSGVASDKETGTNLEMKMTIDAAFSNIGVNSEIVLPTAAETKQPIQE